MSPRHSSRTTMAALGTVAFIAGVVLLVAPSARAQSHTVTVTPRSESWYRPIGGVAVEGADTCDLPVGCAPTVPEEVTSPPSPYPEGTLHVGVSGGTEDARTYLAMDLSELPIGVAISGGTLRLPLSAEPEAGTVAPESADLRICAVDEFVVDGADGDIVGAPAIDCSVSAPATYIAAEDKVDESAGSPGRFEANLEPFLDRWAARNGSLAVVPGESVGPDDTWHLTFSRRDRESGDAAPVSDDSTSIAEALPISASLRMAEPDDEENLSGSVPTTEAPPIVVGPSLQVQGSTPALPEAGQVEVGVAVDQADEIVAPQPIASPSPIVELLGDHFAYPVVFLLPLVVGAGAIWAARNFTVDLAAVRPVR